MDLDEALILRLESLARLELGVEERRRLGAELARILDYVAQIEELDAAALAANPPRAARPAGEAHPRSDATAPCLPASRVLAGAPRAENGYFLVPPVIDAEAEADHA